MSTNGPRFFNIKKRRYIMYLLFVMSALHIFPGRRQPSIVCTTKLNYRVRNGNGRFLQVINTDYFILRDVLSKLNRSHLQTPLSKT